MPARESDEALALALYHVRCQDAGMPPSESGLQRFLSALLAQASNESTMRLRGLQLGARAGQVLARSLDASVTALDLNGNGGFGEAGARELIPLIEAGSLRVLDLGGCNIGGGFASREAFLGTRVCTASLRTHVAGHYRNANTHTITKLSHSLVE